MDSEKEPVKDEKPDASQSTARESIKALTSISQELPGLLQSAGSAIALLSTNPSVPNAPTATLQQRQTSFAQHVEAYYTNLNAIQTALLKQVDLLEEARILPSEHVDDSAEAGLGSGAMDLGKFNVAWLNARSRDVGREKERELVADAKAWLNQTKTESNGTKAETEEIDVMEE